MGNVRGITEVIREKTSGWLLGLERAPARSTLVYGIAAKSGILFESLVQEAVRCLLRVFPEPAGHRLAWRPPHKISWGGRADRRCLAANIALLAALQYDLAERTEASSPDVSVLMNRLRKARNSFAHPQIAAMAEECSGEHSLFEDDEQITSRTRQFIVNLKAFAESEFMEAVVAVEKDVGAYDDFAAFAKPPRFAA